MRTNKAAGGVVVGSDKRIVVIEQHGNSWSLPKGGVEEGESLLQTALREVREETGLNDLYYLGELGSYERKSIGPGGQGESDEWGIRERTFFLFLTKEHALAPQDREVTNAKWLTIDETLALLTHPKDREFLAAVRPKIEAAVE
jgi:bis(5'-nucleosidyl)-tetraphosphatase